MTSARFKLSAFGDEIADDLMAQLDLLRSIDVGYLELRGVWGKNVLDLSDEEVSEVKRLCQEQGIAISAIGSPVGKSDLSAPIARELNNLRRIFEIADALETRLVRVFSFYPDDISTNQHYDQYVDAVIERLQQMTALAESGGFTLILENEKEIVGDSIKRCHALLSRVDSPHLRFAWDPANFVQVDGLYTTEKGWDSLGGYTDHVHIKDVDHASGTVTVAGGGDGQVRELLERLRDRGYDGFLALEPHLAIAGHSSGFSGPHGMTEAVSALRALMAEVGCMEIKPGT